MPETNAIPPSDPPESRRIDTGGGDYAEGDIDKRQGAFVAHATIHGDVIGQQTIVAAPLSPSDRDNRRRLLGQVRAFWITGVLEQSLFRDMLIDLHMQNDPQSVSFYGPRLATRRAKALQPLPAGTAIDQVYREAFQRLLILGAPGAGKTTLLLELARRLLDDAERDETRPMPVVFNLSSWVQQQLPLLDWLALELRDQYGVSRRIAQRWLGENRILPLLDGLDEVAEAQRAGCVAAINAFLREHGSEGLVVCSRSADYRAIGAQLALDAAVELLPLDDSQIDAYLALFGEQLADIRAVFAQDAALRELARTPLFLHVLALTYTNRRPNELFGLDQPAQRRALFEQYVQRMFERPARSDPQRYTRARTMRWLGWLAARLSADTQSIFQIELMQPWWPQRLWQRGLYVLVAALGATLETALFGALFGVLAGLVIGLSLETLIQTAPALIAEVGLSWLVGPGSGMGFGITFGFGIGALFGAVSGFCCGVSVGLLQFIRVRQQSVRMIVGAVLAAGLALALFGALGFGGVSAVWMSGPIAGVLGLAGGALARRGAIRPTEAIRWSWQALRKRWYLAPAGGLIGGLVGSLVGGPINGLAFGLIVGLVAGLAGGFIQIEVQTRVHPNQGTWYALRRAISTWLLTMAAAGGCIGLGIGLGIGLLLGLGMALIGGLAAALIGALVAGPAAGLYFGGLAFVQHFAVRLVCAIGGDAPWRYPQFLEYAAERMLLRRAGGSYLFVHRFLLEYVAEQDDQPAA